MENGKPPEARIFLFDKGTEVDTSRLKTAWIVYRDPDDFPGETVARMWFVNTAEDSWQVSPFVLRLDTQIGDPSQLTTDHLKSGTLLAIRKLIQLIKPGALMTLPENPNQHVLELWI